jgi:predicted nucleic acid-binding protein
LEREAPDLYVVDAFVAVKWFVPERKSTEALEVKESYQRGEVMLLAPDLLLYEMANAMRFHPVAELSREEITKAVEAVIKMQFVSPLNEGDWSECVNLSFDENISIYDASYLALTRREKCVLLTADQRLLRELSDDHRRIVTPLSGFRQEHDVSLNWHDGDGGSTTPELGVH